MKQAFEVVDVFVKRLLTCFSSLVAGFGFTAHKTFAVEDIAVFFEGLQMAGQVSVRNPKHVFQLTEINPVVYHKHGHNAQADAAFEYFIEFSDNMFHLSSKLSVRSGGT